MKLLGWLPWMASFSVFMYRRMVWLLSVEMSDSWLADDEAVWRSK